jgi:3',5'-nucleoside bisphosphate phosphatase
VRIDLHTHSTASDGTETPAQVMATARENGLDVVALTDHDSIRGWEEARSAAPEGLTFVPGAEVSCLTESGISLHVLGLLFDPEYAPLLEAMETSRDDRVPRMREMVRLLSSDGISVTMEDVMESVPTGATVGRPHLADTLVKLGHVPTRDAAFTDLLHNDSKYYVDHICPDPVSAVRMIKAAGGIAIFAHPGASKRGEVVDRAQIDAMAAAGLDALEVDHRDHDETIRVNLREIANELGLLCTGASDYHGTGKLNRIGENLTSPDVWAALVESRKA